MDENNRIFSINTKPYSENCKRAYSPPKYIQWLVIVYVYISFFEIYLTPFIGSNTKFYLLLIIGLFILKANNRIKLNIYNALILGWFIYKVLSLLWSDGSYSQIVRTHFLSQIGMTLFFFVFVGTVFTKEFLSLIINALLYASFLFGILSIASPGAFLDEEFVARQVLTLFGQQNDPNNCAAFLLIGIAISAYYILYVRKQIIFNVVVILVNCYALIMTASRGGFVSLGCIVLTLIFLPGKEKKFTIWQILLRLIVVIIIFSIGVYFIVNFVPSNSLERLLDFSDYQGGSGRSIKWEIAFDYFLQHPIRGCGWGGYNVQDGVIHNTYLTLLCDGGILGTFPMALCILITLTRAIKKRNPLVILILICGLLPAVFIDSINKRFFWNSLIFGIMLLRSR